MVAAPFKQDTMPYIYDKFALYNEQKISLTT